VLRFINKEVCPPNGFRYFVKETGVKFHAWTWRHLLEQVHAHLKANNLPIPHDWEQRVEDYACGGMGPDVCEELDPRFGWLSGAMLKFKTVVAGTKILGAWLAAGKPMVPQAQADSRSEVCASCVHNQDPKDCQTCAWPVLHGLIVELLGSKKSKRHADLKACASCGCNLQVKCWLPVEHLKASFAYGELPEWCWVRKEMEGING
jgi:hypothetical protein